MHDQDSHARVINERVLGVGTTKLRDITVTELATAIKRCCEDEGIRTNVNQLAEQMANEDGAGRATEIITCFLRDEVKTGN